MEYAIQIMEAEKIINVTAKGLLDKQTEDLMTYEILSSVTRLGLKKVLLDMREVEFDMSLAAIFQRAQELREQRIETRSFSLRVAIVYFAKDKKAEENFGFFENTARNRGLPYKVFKDTKEALAWLTEAPLA